MRGKLIAIEGVDYCGKTTCIEAIKPILKEKYGDIFIYTREPGNLIKPEKDIKIRKILLEEQLDPEQQTYLFASNRYDHTKDIIDQLNKGKNVIVDRYFLSSIIYQGNSVGDKLVLHLNKNVLRLLFKADVTVENIIFKITKTTYNQRRVIRDSNDVFEKESEEAINKRIETVLKIMPDHYIPGFIANYHTINARKPIKEVIKDVLAIIEKIIKS